MLPPFPFRTSIRDKAQPAAVSFRPLPVAFGALVLAWLVVTITWRNPLAPPTLDATVPLWGTLAALLVIAALCHGGERRLHWPVIGLVAGVALAPGALILLSLADLPSWWPAIAVLVLLVLFPGSVTSRVPLYLSNRQIGAVLASRLTGKTPQTMVDLGCGTGRVVLAVARLCPNARVIGVETAPLLFAIAWLRVRLSGLTNVEIGWISLWRFDLAGIDLAYCFLSPAPMADLWRKARREMRGGAVFCSNSFIVPGEEPDTTVSINDRGETRLYIYRIGEAGRETT
ncbi:MAG: methyltransferase domain-containing protein [Geminicoccaceae bacterium]